MADIDVERVSGPGEQRFRVTVDEAGSQSRHEVSLSDEDWERLGQGYESPDQFVRRCFEFLLEREPKESILSRFDVRVIGRYFPEFEATIRAQ